MLPQFRPLEVHGADKQQGTHETLVDTTLQSNIVEGREQGCSVTRPSRAKGGLVARRVLRYTTEPRLLLALNGEVSGARRFA